LYFGMTETSGDTSTALSLVFMILLYFVSLPLHGIILVVSLVQLVMGNGRAFRWVYFYFIVSIGIHFPIAYDMGVLDSVANDAAQFKRTIEEPAQIKLEQALIRRPSDINKVRDALDSGANPNGATSKGRIPLLVSAAIWADTPVIKALLDAGADPNRRSSTTHGLGSNISVKNPLPLDVLAFSENKGVMDSVKILLAAGADPSESIMKLGACRRGDLSLYDLAKNIGASGLQDANDQTCLHHAAATNQAVLIDTLLFNPAYEKENARVMLAMENHIGQYPLDVATSVKNYEAALLIVKAGGKANKKWTVKRVLENQSQAPYLDELKKLLIQNQSK